MAVVLELRGPRRTRSQERLRRQNLNFLERIEHKQIRVTGHKVSCTALYREFKELIITGIATGADVGLNVNPQSLAGECCQKDSDIFLINVPAEVFPAQNFRQLGENGKRK